jgi:hypothetical protein
LFPPEVRGDDQRARTGYSLADRQTAHGADDGRRLAIALSLR